MAEGPDLADPDKAPCPKQNPCDAGQKRDPSYEYREDKEGPKYPGQ